MKSKEIILNQTSKEHHLILNFNDEASAKAEFLRALDYLKANRCQVLCLEVFSGKFITEVVEAFKLGTPTEFPINWILPLVEGVEPILASAHVTALSGASAKVIKTENNTIAVQYGDKDEEYLRVFGVCEKVDNDKGYDHTEANLNELESSLKSCGYSYNDIIRTWFYNEDILAWYDDFNAARTKFYKDRNVFEGLLPASTGIGAPNPSGSFITSGAIAIKGEGKGKTWTASDVNSPLQGGAPEYGSSFARAVLIENEYGKRITISGTASIAPTGETLYLDNIQAQTDLTMEVIKAMLEDNGMSWKDVHKAMIYCLKPEYYETYQNWAKEESMGADFAHCPAYAIVCRHDLLIEVELEAFIKK